MFCAISGEIPKDPVYSTVSGHIYDRRLILQYLKEHGKDPINHHPTTTDDLSPVKIPAYVSPRMPNITSIPSLLDVFQNEWDATALESFKLKQQLAETKQELSTALYENDAAVRLIGTLLKERDDARNALAEFKLAASSTALNVDDLSQQRILDIVNSTLNDFSETRKLRNHDVVQADKIKALKFSLWSSSIHGSVLAVEGEQVIAGGDGNLTLLSTPDAETIIGNFSDAVVFDSGCAYISNGIESSSDSRKVYINRTPTSISAHKLALHPSQQLIAFLSNESWGLIDISSKNIVADFEMKGGIDIAFHPDGHLIAISLKNVIRFFNTGDGVHAADFPQSDTIAFCFSDNGYSFAVADKEQIIIWNLAKQTITTTIRCIVTSLAFDRSGAYLACGTSYALFIYKYDREDKSWIQVHELSLASNKINWNNDRLWVVGSGGLYIVD